MGLTMVFRTTLLQRKCACGGTAGLDGECANCRHKRLRLQRRSKDHASPSLAPAIVHDVLRSPGQPLDSRTRTLMDPRFGHNFSSVRVHTDAKASESARAVDALAYTVGRNIVFREGQYRPDTRDGRTLLAHELSHTVQQTNRSLPDSINQSEISVEPVRSPMEETAERNARLI